MPLYWHFPGYLGAGKDGWRTTPAGAIRAGDWKLIEFFETGKIELYNLAEDIGEKNDLAKKMPDRAKATARGPQDVAAERECADAGEAGEMIASRRRVDAGERYLP